MTKLSEEDHYEEDRSWIFGNLQRAFNQLAEDCQKVLSWFYIDELSLREIGLRLNLSEASATVKRFKCAKYLRQRFKFDEE